MSLDFSKVKVAQIKEALIAAEVDVSDISGKGAYVQKAIEIGLKPEDFEDSEESIVDLNSAELEESDLFKTIPLTKTDALVDNRPTKGSPEWHDYVMAQFFSSEINEVQGQKLPNINGLRRMSILLFGEPIFSGSVDLKTTHSDDPKDPGRAVCTYEVVFEDINNMCTRTYRGIGSSFFGNTDDEFCVFVEAIAETRAESRALRKALGINVNSSEEMTGKDGKQIVSEFVGESSGEWGEDQNITPSQVKVITKMCNDLGVDANKFINKKYHTGQTTEPQFESIDKVPRAIAAAMISELNKYQTMTDTSKEIPQEILV